MSIKAYQEAITDENSKIMTLGILLQMVMYTDEPDVTRIFNDIGGILQDYTGKIGDLLSDLEFELRNLASNGPLAAEMDSYPSEGPETA